MKILICGDRNWQSKEPIRREIKTITRLFGPVTHIIHGCCRGADKMAGEVAEEMGIDVMEFPADWNQYGKKAGILRNIDMLNINPDCALAFHSDINNSKGTKHMTSIARKANIPVYIFVK
jgi:hypothetical protein